MNEQNTPNTQDGNNEDKKVGRGMTPQVAIYDHPAFHPLDTTRDSDPMLLVQPTEPVVHEPVISEMAVAIATLLDVLTEAGHSDPNKWLESLENPPTAQLMTTPKAIFLINRALRLLITERRDILEEDRSAALLSIIDATEVQGWIKALQAVVVPVMVKYNVGVPGLVKVDEQARQKQAEEILSPEENEAVKAKEQ